MPCSRLVRPSLPERCTRPTSVAFCLHRAKDATSAWRNWMVVRTTPPKLLGDCATPLDRNVELSRKHRVNGTPAIVFENGA